MADVSISNLPVGSPTGTHMIPCSNGSTTTRVTLNQVLGLQSGIPSGGIIMWSGSVASIPSGWALCNGANGTPNLVNRFVIAAGSSYSPNAVGGSTTSSGSTDSHTLTIAQIPSHTHVVPKDAGTPGSIDSYGAASESGGPNSSAYNFNTFATGGSEGHSHGISTISIMPPYYALCYIMKL